MVEMIDPTHRELSITRQCRLVSIARSSYYYEGRGESSLNLRLMRWVIPLQRGFLYLVAVMDRASRKVLSWRLSNTLDASFCVEALEEAIARYGTPEIFNSDQGSQFTSFEFLEVLRRADIRISMDGKGRWMDNMFIERLWRSLKYEQVYLAEYRTGSEARAGIDWWVRFYNQRRPHSSRSDQTPNEVYEEAVDPRNETRSVLLLEVHEKAA